LDGTCVNVSDAHAHVRHARRYKARPGNNGTDQTRGAYNIRASLINLASTGWDAGGMGGGPR